MNRKVIFIIVIIIIGICVSTTIFLNRGKENNINNENEENGQTDVSYTYRNYEDIFYHFKLKTPIWLNESQKGLNYAIERGDPNEEVDNHALMLIEHYNEEQDNGMYDTSYFDTAENALYELQAGKVDMFFFEQFGGGLADAQCTTTPCELDGREAVRYEGTYTLDAVGNQWVVGVTGYCVLGKYTPIMFCVMDFSDAQDKLPELAKIVDEMSITFKDSENIEQ